MIKNITVKAIVLLAVIVLLAGMILMFGTDRAFADAEQGGESVSAESAEASMTGSKAIAAAVVVGIAGAAGAVSMGISIKQAMEGMARQPEATGNIRTTMMLGLVFIETVVIYALIVAILIIFVL